MPLIEPRDSKPFQGRLVAVDPGITTGIAIRAHNEIMTCVVEDYDIEEVCYMIAGADQVIIERFIIGGALVSMNPERLKTIELVGIVHGYCIAKKIAFESATPAQRHSHQHEAERNIGDLIPKSKVAVHEADALAHLFAFEYRYAKR